MLLSTIDCPDPYSEAPQGLISGLVGTDSPNSSTRGVAGSDPGQNSLGWSADMADMAISSQALGSPVAAEPGIQRCRGTYKGCWKSPHEQCWMGSSLRMEMRHLFTRRTATAAMSAQALTKAIPPTRPRKGGYFTDLLWACRGRGTLSLASCRPRRPHRCFVLFRSPQVLTEVPRRARAFPWGVHWPRLPFQRIRWPRIHWPIIRMHLPFQSGSPAYSRCRSKSQQTTI